MKSLAPSGEELVSMGVVISRNPMSVILRLSQLTTLARNTILSFTAGLRRSRKRYFSLVSSRDCVDAAISKGSCS